MAGEGDLGLAGDSVPQRDAAVRVAGGEQDGTGGRRRRRQAGDLAGGGRRVSS